MKKELAGIARDEAAADDDDTSSAASSRLLVRLLGLCHKYQVTRLQNWCESRLCKYVSVAEVSSILCQAHLYQAEKLENICLGFMKANMADVVGTPGFAEVTKKWPEVILKVNMFVAGVSGAKASSIIEEGFGRNKRPSEELDGKEEEKDDEKDPEKNSKRQRSE